MKMCRLGLEVKFARHGRISVDLGNNLHIVTGTSYTVQRGVFFRIGRPSLGPSNWVDLKRYNDTRPKTKFRKG